MKKRGPLKLVMPADSLQQIKDLSRNALLGPRKGTQCCASFNALYRVLLAAALVEPHPPQDLVSSALNLLGSTTISRDPQGKESALFLNQNLTGLIEKYPLPLWDLLLWILRDLTRQPSSLDSAYLLADGPDIPVPRQ